MEIIESEYSGFFNIPRYSNYCISQNGNVFNKSKMEFVLGSTNPDGYHNFRLTDDCGITLTWGRHRLLCYVFKPVPNIENLVVNHKNGIKGDDFLDNLEWTTHQGNIEHAGANGLTEKCIEVSVRDIVTGEIFNFPSIVKCARHFGLSKDAVIHRLKIGEHRVFPELKQYRKRDDDKPWIQPSNGYLDENGVAKSILVKHVVTGVVDRFNSATSVAIRFGTALPTISLWLKQLNQPVLPGLIQIKFTTDETPWRNVKDPYLELESYTKKRCVVVFKGSSDKMIYTSAVECAKALNIKPTALHYRLKSKGNIIFEDGYCYCYYSDYNSGSACLEINK